MIVRSSILKSNDLKPFFSHKPLFRSHFVYDKTTFLIREHRETISQLSVMTKRSSLKEKQLEDARFATLLSLKFSPTKANKQNSL